MNDDFGDGIRRQAVERSTAYYLADRDEHHVYLTRRGKSEAGILPA